MNIGVRVGYDELVVGDRSALWGGPSRLRLVWEQLPELLPRNLAHLLVVVLKCYSAQALSCAGERLVWCSAQLHV
jgi:hypothetical protein